MTSPVKTSKREGCRLIMSEVRHVSLAGAQAAPLTPGDISSTLVKHGSMTLEYYVPQGADTQTPHIKDEIYIVSRGHGWFRHEAGRIACAQGDALFVPAGIEHRFEDFSDDFETWVIFYGSEGGE
jgi:mannose-6-phosphate isomerase-like protein (cupin superfamily)